MSVFFPFADHEAVQCDLTFHRDSFRSPYWKLPTFLLQHSGFCDSVKALINHYHLLCVNTDNVLGLWEDFKSEVQVTAHR